MIDYNLYNRIKRMCTSCFKKVRYSTLKKATQMAEIMTEKYGTVSRPYWCKHCLGYHLTTKPINEEFKK